MTIALSLAAVELALRVAGAVAQGRFWREIEAREAAGGPHANVLCLGESTTGGLWCDYGDSYPAQLERMLKASRPDVRCLVPPHVGQNTSQMAHQIDRYLASFRPRVVLLMCGANDSWSVDETDAGMFDARFAPSVFDSLKLVKFARFGSLGMGPTYSAWPPEHGYVEREACRRLWRFEVQRMVRASRAAGAVPILMTYPRYAVPPLEDVQALARDEVLVVVRNDLDFPDGADQRYLFADGRHPTPAGYALVARNALPAVAAALR